MRLRARKVLLICGLVLAALFAWTMLAGPMLVHVRFGPMGGDPRLALWNPIRSRTPEHYGTELLRKIQSDNCEQGVTVLEIQDQEKTAACKKQSLDPVVSNCRLVERVDKASTVWLLFRCPYKRQTEAQAEVGMTLERQGAGWSLHSYERIY